MVKILESPFVGHNTDKIAMYLRKGVIKEAFLCLIIAVILDIIFIAQLQFGCSDLGT